MKIAITGGCGFVGSNLAERFAHAGHDVTVLDNLMREGSYLNLQRLRRYHNIRFLHADIRISEDLTSLFDYEAIFDCAAQTSVTEGEKEPGFNFINNTLGICNILEIVRKTGAPLVFCSTNKVYPSETMNCLPIVERETRFEWDLESIGDQEHIGLSVSQALQGERLAIGINETWPLGLGARSIYGASKASADILCQEYRDAFQIPVFVNRFSCLAGPWQFGMPSQGWYVWFIIAAYFGLPVTYYGWKGKQLRDVLFIEDVFSLIEKQLLSALDGKGVGGVYNIGGGIQNAVSLHEHTERLRSAGLKPIVKDSGGVPRRSDQVIYISDIGKAQDEFGWSPNIRIDSGFEECLNWIRENSKELESIFLWRV